MYHGRCCHVILIEEADLEKLCNERNSGASKPQNPQSKQYKSICLNK